MRGWKTVIRYMMKHTGCTYKQGEAFHAALIKFYTDMEKEQTDPDSGDCIEISDEEFDERTKEMIRIFSEQTGIDHDLVCEMDNAFRDFLEENREDIEMVNEFLDNHQDKIPFLINLRMVVLGILTGTIIHMILRMVW